MSGTRISGACLAIIGAMLLAGGPPAGVPSAFSAPPDGNPENTANLQAALDQEQKHAQILANAGAVSSFKHFYFPASAFASLGYTSRAGTFLWVLDHLETACIAFYLAAVKRFAVLGRSDLAVLAVRNLAVECEHFVECVRFKKMPRSNAAAGLLVVRLLETASQSLAGGGGSVPV